MDETSFPISKEKHMTTTMDDKYYEACETFALINRALTIFVGWSTEVKQGTSWRESKARRAAERLATEIEYGHFKQALRTRAEPQHAEASCSDQLRDSNKTTDAKQHSTTDNANDL